MELQEYESALHCLSSAQTKKPFDNDISGLLIKVATYVQLSRIRLLCTHMHTQTNEEKFELLCIAGAAGTVWTKKRRCVPRCSEA